MTSIFDLIIFKTSEHENTPYEEKQNRMLPGGENIFNTRIRTV